MKVNNENIQIRPSKKEGEKKVTIILENDLTIYSVDELKTIIVDNYKKNDEINFELKNIKNIDLTFIQLFFSLKHSAIGEGKTVSFDINMPDDLKLLFNNADINKIFRKI